MMRQNDRKEYRSFLNLRQTEQAIKQVKDVFERELAEQLNLTRVSAPMMVFPSSGLNDELNGVERRVEFSIRGISEPAEIVQSLAKWKRNALARYHFEWGTGLYTDMNAIRRDETLDFLHSAYVDQWDWERVISKEERNSEFLKEIVKKIYRAFLNTAEMIYQTYPVLRQPLAEEVYFITAQELESAYPNLTAKEREYEICKKKKAVFLMQIGDRLASGVSHDGRAADYDDWQLNGDLLLYDRDLDLALELSSMGIRVDEASLVRQLKIKNEEYKLNNPYVQSILNRKLPDTVGGGIGQSRLCMFLLRKAHIGEVQASLWPKEEIERLERQNIFLL